MVLLFHKKLGIMFLTIMEDFSFMKFWKLTAPHTLQLEQSEPTLLNEKTNVKVRIEHVLLGKYDLALYNGEAKGKYPVVLGKNAVGVVSETHQAETILTIKIIYYEKISTFTCVFKHYFLGEHTSRRKNKPYPCTQTNYDG